MVWLGSNMAQTRASKRLPDVCDKMRASGQRLLRLLVISGHVLPTPRGVVTQAYR